MLKLVNLCEYEERVDVKEKNKKRSSYSSISIYTEYTGVCIYLYVYIYISAYICIKDMHVYVYRGASEGAKVWE